MREIKQGSIWREVDPRFRRFVRVETIAPGDGRTIGLRTVIAKGGHWVTAPRARLSYALAARFNGKRGNYEFHAES